MPLQTPPVKSATVVLSGRAIKRMVKIHAAAAGMVFSAVHPYTLHHSCTTHLLKGGANLSVI